MSKQCLEIGHDALLQILTQPPVQWVPGALYLGVNRPGREADHSPPSSTDVKNAWRYTSTPQYAFTAWYSVKAQGKIYFYLYLTYWPFMITFPYHVELYNFWSWNSVVKYPKNKFSYRAPKLRSMFRVYYSLEKKCGRFNVSEWALCLMMTTSRGRVGCYMRLVWLILSMPVHMGSRSVVKTCETACTNYSYFAHVNSFTVNYMKWNITVQRII
jgi:hypothetical protein